MGWLCTGIALTSPTITAKTSKSKTKQKWDQQVPIIYNWNSGADGLT
jgi:hypothetical protein